MAGTLQTTPVDWRRLAHENYLEPDVVKEILDIDEGVPITEPISLETARETACNRRLPKKIREAALEAWCDFSSRELKHVLERMPAHHPNYYHLSRLVYGRVPDGIIRQLLDGITHLIARIFNHESSGKLLKCHPDKETAEMVWKLAPHYRNQA
ncbi:MAG: hypothetical protein Q8O98_00060 [bacterium]|nr:hypothetical protein [bacterium]